MTTVARWLLVWIGLAAVWLLYQGVWNEIEIYAALSAGALAAAVSFVAFRTALPAVRLEPLRLRLLVGLPWRVLSEFVVVTGVLLRAAFARRVPEGEFRAVPFPVGGERPPERGRRAFVSIVVGYAPNSYVVDMDLERKLALMHFLRPVPRGEELP